MSPARTITLFAPPPRSGSGSSSWMASLALHAAVCGWIFYGLVHAPYVQRRTLHQRFMVRELNVPMTQPEVLRYAASGSPVHPAAQAAAGAAHSITAPASSVAAPAPAPQETAARAAAAPAAPGPVPSQERPAPALPAAIQLPQMMHQQQTLIQPDAPKDLLLQQATPVPLVMMWAQREPPKPAVASPPPKPAVANLHSSIARPNREAAPAPINLSSTNFHSAMPTIAPGTTSPVVVRAPDAPKQMPTVAAPSDTQPAPVRIISLSDRQQVEGPVAVPLANASAPPSTSQSLTAGKSENSSGTGHGNSGNPNNSQAGQSTAAAGKQPGATGPAGQGTARASNGASPQTGSGPAGPAPGAGAATVANAGPAASSGPGIGSENPASVKRITQPKDGQFGVVVVGSSLADEYPETAAIWAGRLVYTVYLHVGMGKELDPRSTRCRRGRRQRLMACGRTRPWPYDIVVPRLDAGDYNTDALMVHGFVNDSGHFERLNVVLPPQFAQSKFVLSALEQWQFRAARQNGQPTQVEILLIIPEQDE